MKTAKAPECTRHDGDCMDLDECPDCIAWMDGEEAYWAGYFGGTAAIKARSEAEKFYRDECGIDITNPSTETMDELRRLK